MYNENGKRQERTGLNIWKDTELGCLDWLQHFGMVPTSQRAISYSY